MKILFAFVFVLFFQRLDASTSSFEKYLAQKKETVSHSRHLPYILSHGKKTELSVLLVHGTYSSPLHFRGMAHAFFNQGYNVVSLLLPGHWDKDLYSMNKMEAKDFISEMDKGYEFAKELGSKVILSGHSLGGLLSIEQALKRPKSEVHAVVLISPAIKLRSTIMLTCKAGVALKLTGNNFTLSTPNGFDVPNFTPKAGFLIQELYKKIQYNELKTPMYLAFTWLDILLDPGALSKFYWDLPVEHKRLRTYGRLSGITHDNISQGGDDILGFTTRKPNPDFQEMMDDALNFVESLPNNL